MGAQSNPGTCPVRLPAPEAVLATWSWLVLLVLLVLHAPASRDAAPDTGKPGPWARACLRAVRGGRLGGVPHLRIFTTRPAPTVRPPSRIAKLRPSSMAIGWIRLTVISVLSPGMTISVPSGSWMTPVTSVVRK